MSGWAPFGVMESGFPIERREVPEKGEIHYRLTRDNAFVKCAATNRLEEAFPLNPWLLTAFLDRMEAAL